MKRLVIGFLLALPTSVLAQTTLIKSGSTVYIAPANGYETYLASAMQKKHVPLVVVTDKSKADFVLTSTVQQSEPDQPAIVINNNSSATPFERGWALSARGTRSGATSVSIALIQPQSSQVVFAYSVEKDRVHNLQSTAEACAKHLKDVVRKK